MKQYSKKNGSLGIALTFLKLDLWSPGAGFISKSDKEKKIVRKSLSFTHTKSFNTFLKMDAIPCGYNSTSTKKNIDSLRITIIFPSTVNLFKENIKNNFT